MRFSQVAGNETLKQRMRENILSGRVSHAQLFMGADGAGALPMALAYAGYLLCTGPKENDSCGTCPGCLKAAKLVHPDIHFTFPYNTTQRVSKNPSCDQFLPDWREALAENPYLNLFDWLMYLGIEKKQGNINVEEAGEIMRKLSLKAYEGEYKVMIIWMAEKMNVQAANKLLKILEEPPERTVFLLVVEQYDQLLATITSRTQLVKIKKPSREEFLIYLTTQKGLDAYRAEELYRLSGGNINEALKLLANVNPEVQNMQLFQQWMRFCYKPDVARLIAWSDEMAGLGREQQKSFLTYSLQMVRESLMLHVKAEQVVHLGTDELGFARNFSPFIHPANVPQIMEVLGKSTYAIERNANPRITFLHTSFKMMELLRRPAPAVPAK